MGTSSDGDDDELMSCGEGESHQESEEEDATVAGDPTPGYRGAGVERHVSLGQELGLLLGVLEAAGGEAAPSPKSWSSLERGLVAFSTNMHCMYVNLGPAEPQAWLAALEDTPDLLAVHVPRVSAHARKNEWVRGHFERSFQSYKCAPMGSMGVLRWSAWPIPPGGSRGWRAPLPAPSPRGVHGWGRWEYTKVRVGGRFELLPMCPDGCFATGCST